MPEAPRGSATLLRGALRLDTSRSEARTSVGLPAQQRTSDRHIVCRDLEQIPKDALARGPLRSGDHGRMVTVTAIRIAPALDGHMGSMHRRCRSDVFLDVYESAAGKIALV